MSSQEQIEKTQLPSFFVRWFILLRVNPHFLIDWSFISGVISGKNPVLWDNLLRIEKKRRVRKNAGSVDQTSVPRPKGIWRNED